MTDKKKIAVLTDTYAFYYQFLYRLKLRIIRRNITKSIIETEDFVFYFVNNEDKLRGLEFDKGIAYYTYPYDLVKILRSRIRKVMKNPIDFLYEFPKDYKITFE